MNLDEMEKQSKHDLLIYRNGADYEQVWADDAETILALIEMVRKRNAVLNRIHDCMNRPMQCELTSKHTNEAFLDMAGWIEDILETEK